MKGLIETAIGREREEMRVVARGIGGTTLVEVSRPFPLCIRHWQAKIC